MIALHDSFSWWHCRLKVELNLRDLKWSDQKEFYKLIASHEMKIYIALSEKETFNLGCVAQLYKVDWFSIRLINFVNEAVN